VLLTKLDPMGNLSGAEVLNKMESYVIKYQHLVLQDSSTAVMDIKGEHQIYKSSHQLTLQPTWGDVPID
jgi:hypothetical protein